MVLLQPAIYLVNTLTKAPITNTFRIKSMKTTPEAHGHMNVAQLPLQGQDGKESLLHSYSFYTIKSHKLPLL